MADGVHPSDYHSLLGLHHSIRLRRGLRDGQLRSEATFAGSPLEGAPTVETWSQREEDQRALRESLPLLEPLEETIGLLYGVLFRDQPFLRSMFPDSLIAQRGRLKWSLLALIDALDRPEQIVEVFAQSGRDHRKLGLRPAHYTAFGAALAEALAGRAGSLWNDRYEQAWSRAFWFIARVMISSAEAATSQAPYTEAVVVAHEQRRPDLAVMVVRPRQPYPFLAGQHASIESPHVPRTWRFYTMANPPGGDGLLEFHIRATGVGHLSDVLVYKTGVDDVVRLGPARGMMTLAQSTVGDPVVLVGGGTGVAGVRSLVGQLARSATPPPTWLFVGARRVGDLYDLPALTAMTRRSPWLRLVCAVREGPIVWDGPTMPQESLEQGDVVEALVRRGDLRGRDVFLCGPAAMVEAARAAAAGLGAATDRVRFDPQ